MIRLWEWLRGSRRRKGAFLYAIVMGIAIAWTAVTTPREAPLEVDRDPGPLHNVERAAFDWQMNALRRLYPRTVDKDVVLIGIDEATYAHYPEPVALWHRHFGDVLRTLARAGPQAVGVDVAPPERSYDDILRGSDLALMRGMIDVRRASVLVYVRTLSDKRKFLPVQSNLMNLLGEEGVGLDQQVFDNPDLTSRRFGELRDAADGSPVPSFAGRILRRTGRPVLRRSRFQPPGARTYSATTSHSPNRDSTCSWWQPAPLATIWAAPEPPTGGQWARRLRAPPSWRVALRC